MGRESSNTVAGGEAVLVDISRGIVLDRGKRFLIDFSRGVVIHRGRGSSIRLG